MSVGGSQGEACRVPNCDGHRVCYKQAMRGMLQAARSYRVATLVPIAGLFLAGLMALSACSSAVLSFFFDGVPSPGDGAEKPSPETAQQVEPIGPKPAPPRD